MMKKGSAHQRKGYLSKDLEVCIDNVVYSE